jgi:hypothetical protein
MKPTMIATAAVGPPERVATGALRVLLAALQIGSPFRLVVP